MGFQECHRVFLTLFQYTFKRSIVCPWVHCSCIFYGELNLTYLASHLISGSQDGLLYLKTSSRVTHWAK
ncbi:hypothetical protein XELAEV_18017101mg [Xenopus laevis]|uniref:Uncharacterized protein n=1 Tax=Xenopus laevis TaxID=8355 RepID=A0A974DCQ0_XENLA|nr:hypothetical protein XELAEV_18017101mg [Xenopus laevis]